MRQTAKVATITVVYKLVLPLSLQVFIRHWFVFVDFLTIVRWSFLQNRCVIFLIKAWKLAQSRLTYSQTFYTFNVSSTVLHVVKWDYYFTVQKCYKLPSLSAEHCIYVEIKLLLINNRYVKCHNEISLCNSCVVIFLNIHIPLNWSFTISI